MKRLFALVGLIYLAVQTAAFYTCKELGIVCVIPAFVTGLLCVIFVKDKYKKKTFCSACAAVIAAGLVFYFYSAYFYMPLQNTYDGQEVQLRARLVEEPHKSYGVYYYELAGEKINSNETGVKILLKSTNQIDLEPFDYIECTVTLEKCDNKYYISKNYVYLANADYEFDYNVIPADDYPPYYYAIKARQSMKNALEVLMPERLASMSKAIALGDKFALDSSIRADFAKTGMSYLVVVSGLHLAIVAAFATAVLRKIFRSRYITSFGTILIIIAFMAVTGFASSVVRAGIMLIIIIFGRLILYEHDSLNSLGIAALFLCVPNPYAAGDVGMLLSFSATAGIVLFSEPLSEFVLSKTVPKIKLKIIKRVFEYTVKTLSVSFSAFIAILPVALLAFHSFSPIVLLASVIITPFVSVLIICILLCSILYYTGIFSVLAYPFALIACIINSFIINVVRLLADLKFSVIYVNTVDAVIFLSGTAVVIALALLFKDYKTKLKYSVFMIVIMIFAGWSTSVLPKADNLHVLKAGEGTTALLESSKGLAVLSCGGSARETTNVIEEIALSNFDISFLAVADNNKTASRFASQILEEFDYASVLLYDTDRTDEEVFRKAHQADALLTFSENQTAQCVLWNEVKADFLNVDGSTWEYVKSADYSVLIVPEKGNCNDIPDRYKTADIIISSACPKNYNLLKCGIFVYTGNEETLKEYTGCFAEISNQIATTINDNITIPLKE